MSKGGAFGLCSRDTAPWSGRERSPAFGRSSRRPVSWDVRLAEIFDSQRVLPATVDFVDIAGIVRGASEGE
ncbi:hypothetical protein, partial [Streptomyces sp. NPDC006170]|uniref:hypothetical protein n=1 Tax=Streptomyces sp. NPDC006170 TaxID=3154469 RepID=UPI0033B463D1